MNVGHWMLMMSVVFTEVAWGAAQAADVDICSLQKVMGPCRSNMERYFYNVETKACERFSYGGCQGNGNNFRTIEACNDRCVGPPEDLCSLPPVITTSQVCLASIPSWTYDRAQGKCVPYEYGGCGGTENLFNTEKLCQSSCDLSSLAVCERPPVLPTSPSCFGSIPSWTYDSAQGKCVPYEYGGCGGTENLFDTEKQCQSSCDPSSVDVCERPPVLPTSPSCFASIPSWTYDPARGKCVPYEYGGCGGTENLFDTEKLCQSSCDPASLDVCERPPVLPTSPSCFASLPFWTYDSAQQKCVPYEYGGCGGTENLFDTKELCQSECGQITQNACDQPKITGPCAAFIERFWFNRNTGVCEKFVYGGCQGNDNNFATEQDCGLTCYRKQPRSNGK